MDYKEIGTRIRQYRKLRKLSQEQLAERVDISTTHMSHIETGSTKLSLQVLVRLAMALEVPTDSLIFESCSQPMADKLQGLLSECSENQVEFIASIVESMKAALDKYQA